jgi:hypothetical protein
MIHILLIGSIVIACGFILVRDAWVFTQRVSLWNSPKYENLPSYFSMLCKFWVWDIDKFLPAKVTLYIVSAAVRDPVSNHIIMSIRHYDALFYQILEGLLQDKDIDRVAELYTEEGFITNQGLFVDRAIAYNIAKSAGQIRKKVGGGKALLYSENLY